jgi:hypothetical protein
VRRFFLLLVLALAALSAPSAASAAAVPTGYISAYGYARYYALLDYSNATGNAFTAFNYGCNPSASQTPRFYPCWYTYTLGGANGSTSEWTHFCNKQPVLVDQQDGNFFTSTLTGGPRGDVSYSVYSPFAPFYASFKTSVNGTQLGLITSPPQYQVACQNG